MIADFQLPIADCRLDPPLSPLCKGGGTLRGSVAPWLRGSAFTLVEMVIVVAVVLLILGIVLPAASTLWRERRVAEAQNVISGMLMTTRAKAMQNDFGDSGLFFYLDEAGVQRIASIAQDASKAANPLTREAWADVFNVLPERIYSLPVPMRVVPRYAVCGNENGRSTCHPDRAGPDPSYELFSTDAPDELTNNDFNAPPMGADQAQRHRNFFTMVYSSNGQLRVRRDVLIRDVDADSTENPGGDVTGLIVGGTDTQTGPVAKFYNQTTNVAVNLDPNGVETVNWLVTDPANRDVALNLPSVDGLLLYDESLFAEAGTPDQKRQFLLDAALPFYVHRLTGAVVRGPVGENAVTITP